MISEVKRSLSEHISKKMQILLKIIFAYMTLLIVISFSGCTIKSTYHFRSNHLNANYKKNIILIHGLNSDTKIWDSKFIDKISKQYKRNVYTFEYPTNLIDFFNENDSYGNIVNQLKLFIDKNQLNNIIFICHSQGGIIAQKYILQNLNKINTDKLILLGTPSIGSVLADYANFFPFSSIHLSNLKNEIFNLLILQENISHYQNSFPKTLAILGSKDIATSINNGFIGFKFAKNYQVPLSHSELYEFEKYNYLYDILDDFLINDFKNYEDNTKVKNNLYIRFPQLSNLKYFVNGEYVLTPLTKQELYENGYQEFIIAKDKKEYRHIGYGYSQNILTFNDLAPNLAVATDDIQVGEFIVTRENSKGKKSIIQKTDIATLNNQNKQYKYQHDHKIKRLSDESLWCRHNNYTFNNINATNNFVMISLPEIDYMTLAEIKDELMKKENHCVIEKRIFKLDKNGKDSILEYVPWVELMQRAFIFKKNVIIDNDKIYDWSIVTTLPKVELQKEYEYIIVKDLPVDYEYEINFIEILDKFFDQKKAHGANFEFDDSENIKIKIHKGNNYHVFYFREKS